MYVVSNSLLYMTQCHKGKVSAFGEDGKFQVNKELTTREQHEAGQKGDVRADPSGCSFGCRNINGGVRLESCEGSLGGVTALLGSRL